MIQLNSFELEAENHNTQRLFCKIIQIHNFDSCVMFIWEETMGFGVSTSK
jgi:hypothetical protein